MKNKNYCLLIGNSRWHWAIKKENHWEYFDTQPNEIKIEQPPLKWAAVGHFEPSQHLKKSNELNLLDIPLKKIPNWIGIDRALGGWGALTEFQKQNFIENELIVVDAGTIFSLTKIGSDGEFKGGQLIPGLSLQRLSMIEATKNLNAEKKQDLPKENFPKDTVDAMNIGTLQILTNHILKIHSETQLPIWICGGDSNIIFQSLNISKARIIYKPNLVMESLVHLEELRE